MNTSIKNKDQVIVKMVEEMDSCGFVETEESYITATELPDRYLFITNADEMLDIGYIVGEFFKHKDFGGSPIGEFDDLTEALGCYRDTLIKEIKK